MNEQTTAVIFRRWRDTGEVFAMFPELPADAIGQTVSVYSHTGQHGAGDPHTLGVQSYPTTVDEYAALKAELETNGYTLMVVKAASPAMRARRYRRAAEFRADHPKS